MDNHYVKKYVALQNQNDEPWQCGLPNLEERLLFIYQNSNFTDVTLTFPGTNITYDAHRLILAIASPVFEGILYGPMRTEGGNVELHDDDPFVMKHIISYCYGDLLDISDMNMALDVYKLADKYFLKEVKKHCCKYIIRLMSKDNVKDVIEFTERFNFSDLKYYCIPYLKVIFEEIVYFEDESNNVISSILLDLNDDWIDMLLKVVSISELEFHESWKYPESPLPSNRLSTIMCGMSHLSKISGCMDAKNVNQIPEFIGRGNIYTPDLCLSVTDPHHAKSVIEAINQDQKFQKHLIAIHIRCGEIWPTNWSPILTERTHRPSVLLISDVDDDKIPWVIEAANALLPQSEGSYNKVFTRILDGDLLDTYNENGVRQRYKLRPINILKLPKSNLTLNGFLTMLQGLSTSTVIFTKVLLQSPYISRADQVLFEQFHQVIECLPMDHNFFSKVFEDFQKIECGQANSFY